MTTKEIEINYKAKICGIKGHFPDNKQLENDLEMKIYNFYGEGLAILESTDSKGKSSYGYLSGTMIGTQTVPVTVETVLYEGPDLNGHNTSHSLSFRKYVKLGRPRAFKVKTTLSSN